MSTVIVFGSTGLLGSRLLPLLQAGGYKVIAQTRKKEGGVCLNPLDRNSIAKAFSYHNPIAIINLIGLTNVDQCEGDPESAWLANTSVVSSITDVILSLYPNKDLRPYLVHVSTDQIYYGHGPHSENSAHPINVYALTKYTGELLAQRINSSILRTNFFGRSTLIDRPSFSDWIIRELKQGNELTLFDDVRFSGIHIETLCAIIILCIKLHPIGIFNVGCHDSISKAQFALELANQLNLNIDNVKIGKLSDVSLRARRPFDMSLNIQKFENVFKMHCPSIINEINKTVLEYKNG